MKQTMASLAVSLVTVLAFGTGTASAQENPLVGSWLGTLNAGGAQLRVVFNVTVDSAGTLNATLDSPDQGASGIPVSEVNVAGDTVEFVVPAVNGGYEGVLSEDRSSIEGTWSQGGASLPLNLEKTEEEIAPPNRPQEPEPPFPYDATDVTYPNNSAPGVALAGTLTTPRGDGPFPAVVLVSGSGPQNRNEELLSHKPFLVLADHLTRQGIAVLRFDDRGIGESTGTFATATSEDFATDALAGIEFLKERPGIDADRLGIVGHSEGGLIAPMAAVGSDDIAFIVLLAGPGLTGEEILILQGALIARAEGASEEAIAANRRLQEKMFAVTRNEPDAEAARPILEQLVRDQIANMTPAQRQAAGMVNEGAVETAIRTQVAQANSPWFRFFTVYDPRPTLRRITVPVLALNGEKDLQVPARENLDAIAEALQEAGNADVTVRELPGLNHLFQTANTGSPTEYANIEETMNPVALQAVSDWILERFGTGR